MDYYNSKDVMEVIGCQKSFAYKVISELIEEFKKEYPEAKTIRGKIPKWYFERRYMNKGNA